MEIIFVLFMYISYWTFTVCINFVAKEMHVVYSLDGTQNFLLNNHSQHSVLVAAVGLCVSGSKVTVVTYTSGAQQ
jgi:hypothetical protein